MSKEQKLFSAIEDNNVAVVEKLLRKRLFSRPVDINITFGDRYETPIEHAARLGRKEIVVILIDKGSKAVSNALEIASAKGNIELVRFLVTKGTDVTPNTLINASEGGHIEVVEFLIDIGTAIDEENIYGRSPLQVASLNGHISVVQFLLAKGADLIPKALIGASEGGHLEVVEYLISKGAAINVGDKYGNTPLTMASWNGHKNVVQFLLSKGAKVYKKNSGQLADFKGSELIGAAQNGHKEIVEILIDSHAAVNAKDVNGNTALIFASSNGDLDIAELLISNGANVNEKGHDDTALTIAIGSGHQELARMLIASGADVNAMAIFDNTPLLLACKKGYYEIVQLLIDKGANINAVDSWGRSASDLAVGNDICSLLEAQAKKSPHQKQQRSSTQEKAGAIDADRKWREQKQAQVEQVYSLIRATFKKREFTFDQLMNLGVSYDDANYILTMLKYSGQVKTAGFKSFKCT